MTRYIDVFLLCSSINTDSNPTTQEITEVGQKDTVFNTIALQLDDVKSERHKEQMRCYHLERFIEKGECGAEVQWMSIPCSSNPKAQKITEIGQKNVDLHGSQYH